MGMRLAAVHFSGQTGPVGPRWAARAWGRGGGREGRGRGLCSIWRAARLCTARNTLDTLVGLLMWSPACKLPEACFWQM